MSHKGEVHYVSTNPELGERGTTACGERSRYVAYSENPSDVTCEQCLSSAAWHEDQSAFQRKEGEEMATDDLPMQECVGCGQEFNPARWGALYCNDCGGDTPLVQDDGVV